MCPSRDLPSILFNKASKELKAKCLKIMVRSTARFPTPPTFPQQAQRSPRDMPRQAEWSQPTSTQLCCSLSKSFPLRSNGPSKDPALAPAWCPSFLLWGHGILEDLSILRLKGSRIVLQLNFFRLGAMPISSACVPQKGNQGKVLPVSP